MSYSASRLIKLSLRRPSCFAGRRIASSLRRGYADQIKSHNEALKEKAKANPELYVLGIVMSVALAGAGYFLGSNPTNSTDQAPVAEVGMPWETNSHTGKYQYHPGNDPDRGVMDAPSALNASIRPDLNLPKRLHDMFNKYGQD